jgi:Putative heavy-metal-binding
MVQGSAVLGQSPVPYSGGISMTGQRFTRTGNAVGTTGRLMNDMNRKLMSQGYWQSYRCPHPFDASLGPHANWGSNAEQVLLHSAWQRGFGTAFRRMVDQAREAGAHGVIGVSDSRQPFADTPALEYRVTGTAVRVGGAEVPRARPWTTHLAGQRLVNAIEGGYMPISAIVQRCWMAVWPYCVTEYFLVGKLTKRDLMGDPVQEVVQVSDAKMKLVEIAAGHVRDEAQSDAVLGLDVEWGDTHLGFGVWVMNVTLRGTRVRRFDPNPTALASERLLQLS